MKLIQYKFILQMILQFITGMFDVYRKYLNVYKNGYIAYQQYFHHRIFRCIPNTFTLNKIFPNTSSSFIPKK